MKYEIKDQGGNVLGVLELAQGLSVDPVSTMPAPPKRVTQKVMTDLAQGYSREDYLANGWTEEDLLAEGMMRVEVVNETPRQEQAATVHPSLQHAELPKEWQTQHAEVPVPPPTPQPEAPTPPPVPQPQETTPPPTSEPPGPSVGPYDQGPAVPPPPAPGPEVPPPPAEGPAVPPPPGPGPDQQPSKTPTEGEQAQGSAPYVEGREFIVRGVSHEYVTDKRGIFFDARAHGVTAEGQPAFKKDGEFKKKRGLEQAEFERIENQILAAMRGGEQPAAQTPPPPVPPADVPGVPPVPGAQHRPAPPAPDNMAELEAALSDWEEVS